jgi:hypothetical protein
MKGKDLSVNQSIVYLEVPMSLPAQARALYGSPLIRPKVASKRVASWREELRRLCRSTLS